MTPGDLVFPNITCGLWVGKPDGSDDIRIIELEFNDVCILIRRDIVLDEPADPSDDYRYAYVLTRAGVGYIRQDFLTKVRNEVR